MKKGQVYFDKLFAGLISETDDGYMFSYNDDYIKNNNPPISVTMPITQKDYFSKTLFSFFDGLIPEGWLLDIAIENWKIDYRNRMELLLTCCNDTIGAVSVRRISEE